MKNQWETLCDHIEGVIDFVERRYDGAEPATPYDVQMVHCLRFTARRLIGALLDLECKWKRQEEADCDPQKGPWPCPTTGKNSFGS